MRRSDVPPRDRRRYDGRQPPSEPVLNYRHSFHAGNFADLFKHVALLRALDLAMSDPAPLLVVDTHAGAGRYRLSAEALANGEAVAVRRLLDAEDAPSVFDPLKQRLVVQDGSLVYPGSPLLAVAKLRADDRLIACELRQDDGADLSTALRPYRPRAEFRLADGYAALVPALRAWPGRALALIDPPFERGDDYVNIAEVVRAALAARPGAAFLIWAPLKDLETFDSLVRAIEAGVSAPGLAAELRLRPPLDPLRLNGCGLLVINLPGPSMRSALEEAGAWIAATLGEPGAGVRIRHLATAKKGGAQQRAPRL